MRALSSANLLGNRIGIDQAKALAAILKEHSTLKSLCGNRGDETKLDMSGKGMRASDAIMLAPEIIDNGAMKILDISTNCIGEMTCPEGWSEESYAGEYAQSTYQHIDGRLQVSPPEGARAEGVISLANAIPDMRAMTKIDVRNNSIGSEGKRALKKAAGVGFFGSRYVRLEFLSFYSKLE
jgi:hypothetical protein